MADVPLQWTVRTPHGAGERVFESAASAWEVARVEAEVRHLVGTTRRVVEP